MYCRMMKLNQKGYGISPINPCCKRWFDSHVHYIILAYLNPTFQTLADSPFHWQPRWYPAFNCVSAIITDRFSVQQQDSINIYSCGPPPSPPPPVAILAKYVFTREINKQWRKMKLYKEYSRSTILHYMNIKK